MSVTLAPVKQNASLIARTNIQGSGDAYGTLASDVVSVGGLSVQEQVFGAVTQTSDDFSGFPNDGILGMAFSTIATSKQPTFFETLIADRKLAAPLFSVHLARNQATGSEVSFLETLLPSLTLLH
jgi:Eukaryotic aspartyl protease